VIILIAHSPTTSHSYYPIWKLRWKCPGHVPGHGQCPLISKDMVMSQGNVAWDWLSHVSGGGVLTSESWVVETIGVFNTGPPSGITWW
jgi:hypothetical protein